MDWFYAFNQQKCGPVSEGVLVQKINSGELPRSVLVWNSGMSEWSEAQASPLTLQFSSVQPPPLPGISTKIPSGTTTRLVGEMGVLTDKVLHDLRELTPQFLMPLDEIKSFRWVKDRNLILLAGVGLFPLLCLSLFEDLKSAYWALALYFSTLWALFFYVRFPSPQVTGKRAAICFFGTGLVSITLLLMVQKVPPLTWLRGWAESDSIIVHWVGMFAGVAIWEELCKLLVVFFTVKTAAEKLTLQALLFYGLMSGLGFGIYEGVSYQMGLNLLANNIGTYYLLNVVRLTTLPFLHAVWTGIAAYFVGLSLLYPERKHGLIVAAVLIPALLHSLHNTFAGLLGFAVDFLSVLALLVYLQKSSAFELRLPTTGTKSEVENKEASTTVPTK